MVLTSSSAMGYWGCHTSRNSSLCIRAGTTLQSSSALNCDYHYCSRSTSQSPQGGVFEVDVVDLQPVQLVGITTLAPGPRQADAQNHLDAGSEAALYAGDEIPAGCPVILLV